MYGPAWQTAPALNINDLATAWDIRGMDGPATYAADRDDADQMTCGLMSIDHL
jgi:hypothetical protein